MISEYYWYQLNARLFAAIAWRHSDLKKIDKFLSDGANSEQINIFKPGSNNIIKIMNNLDGWRE